MFGGFAQPPRRPTRTAITYNRRNKHLHRQQRASLDADEVIPGAQSLAIHDDVVDEVKASARDDDASSSITSNTSNTDGSNPKQPLKKRRMLMQRRTTGDGSNSSNGSASPARASTSAAPVVFGMTAVKPTSDDTSSGSDDDEYQPPPSSSTNENADSKSVRTSPKRSAQLKEAAVSAFVRTLSDGAGKQRRRRVKAPSKPTAADDDPWDVMAAATDVKSFDELREEGASRRFNDDAAYLMSGITAADGEVSVRRSSMLELLDKCVRDNGFLSQCCLVGVTKRALLAVTDDQDLVIRMAAMVFCMLVAFNDELVTSLAAEEEVIRRVLVGRLSGGETDGVPFRQRVSTAKRLQFYAEELLDFSGKVEYLPDLRAAWEGGASMTDWALLVLARLCQTCAHVDHLAMSLRRALGKDVVQYSSALMKAIEEDDGNQDTVPRWLTLLHFQMRTVPSSPSPSIDRMSFVPLVFNWLNDNYDAISANHVALNIILQFIMDAAHDNEDFHGWMLEKGPSVVETLARVLGTSLAEMRDLRLGIALPLINAVRLTVCTLINILDAKSGTFVEYFTTERANELFRTYGELHDLTHTHLINHPLLEQVLLMHTYFAYLLGALVRKDDSESMSRRQTLTESLNKEAQTSILDLLRHFLTAHDDDGSVEPLEPAFTTLIAAFRDMHTELQSIINV